MFVSLPEVGTSLAAGATAGEVESTKAVSEIYSPLAGTVRAVNAPLADDPEVLNDAPYGDGWLFEIEPTDPSAYDTLLDAAAYRALTED